MTREEAIYELRHHLVSIKDCVGLKDSFDAITMAIKALEQEPKWIPVSERLPEDGKRVLITCDGLIRYVKQSTYDEMRGGFCDTCSIKLESDEVIAWMPLPEPYKAESEE